MLGIARHNRVWYGLPLVILFTACGGSDELGGTTKRWTAGGCACPASASTATLSLDCYCAEFPDACPTYEKARETYDASGGVNLCFDSSRWWKMEQAGCGRLTISTGWGLGGGSWVYDATTHELIGVSGFSDVPFGPCDTFGYQVGAVDACGEGTVCSLCDDSGQSCAAVCSMQLRANNGLGLPTYDGSSGALYDCQGLDGKEPRPELHLGCGHVSVVTQFGTNTFALGSHEALRATSAYDRECPNGWGEPESVCDDETVCSLCQGDAKECTAEQLRAE